jgi:hypothetical protein
MTNDHKLYIKDLKDGCFIDKASTVISLIVAEAKQKAGLSIKPV